VSDRGFLPGSTASLAVTSSTGNVALNNGETVLIQNTGSNTAFFKVGLGSALTAATTDTPLQAGGSIVVDLQVGQSNYLAAITASSTTTLYATSGEGVVLLRAANAGTANITADVNVDAKATAAAPSYTEGTENPLSQNLSGQLRTISATNADAAIAAGTAPSKALVAGAVYNSSAPAPTTGQTLALQTDASGRLLHRNSPASTGSQTTVASSGSSGTVLAANAARIGATVFNDSTQVLYLLLSTGGTATTSSYTVQVGASGYYEVPGFYTGALIGIWASANGNARVTEFTV
jgi:hypothetical protein